MAAGRYTSSEAINTLRRPCSVRRLASLAVVVVLPEPCSPTIMIGTGAGALRSMVWLSAPRVSISVSWTIFTTNCPGVTDLITSTPTALAFTFSVKARTTSSATSASKSARRTSRSAASTSASLNAPRRVSRSRMLPSRSDSEFEHGSNTNYARGRIALSGGGLRPLLDRSAVQSHVSCENARSLWSGPARVKEYPAKTGRLCVLWCAYLDAGHRITWDQGRIRASQGSTP